ncbi:MAG: hypothetical protein ACE5E9_06695 [Nitrospinaceae bacterium]
MKKIVAGIVTFIFTLSLSLMSPQLSFGDKKDKLRHGNLKNQTVSHAASHFSFLGGDNINAGAVASATGKIKGLGQVRVDVSSSWDWSGFSSSEQAGPPELEVHPCAFVNTTSHTFTSTNAIGTAIAGGVCPNLTACASAGVGGFTTDDTVTITKIDDDDELEEDGINGKIRGGSICEIFVDTSNNCTINEGMTAFGIIGGSGKYSGATGNGFIHSIFNFCDGTFIQNQIFLHVKKFDSDD